MRFLRNEITANRLAAGIAPAVLFHTDVADWLVVGYEYIPGRAASLASGSPDLPLVASTVAKISAVSAPELRPLRDRWGATDWWNQLAEAAPAVVEGWDVDGMSRWSSLVPELVEGDRLLHTDLHGDQFRIDSGGSVHVVDWGLPASGAPWIDTAFLVLRLIEAGHHPSEAEAWARSLPCFSTIADESLNAFAVYVAGLWSYWAQITPASGTRHRADLARRYAAWRLRDVPTRQDRRG